MTEDNTKRWTIRLTARDIKPFYAAGIRSVKFDRGARRLPTLCGTYGVFTHPKDADRVIPWLKSLGFKQAKVEEC